MNSNEVPLKQNMEKEEYRNIEQVILQNEEKTKCNPKQWKFKKFNYLKYKLKKQFDINLTLKKTQLIW